MIDSLNANGQSKRTVTHDKLYPMQTTVKITNITTPSKVRLTFDQIFEITYLDKSVNNMQIRNKDANEDPLYYGIATDQYYYGQTTAISTEYGDGSYLTSNPHYYFITYANVRLTAQVDDIKFGVVVIGGGGGGGRDADGDGNSPGGGGGGAYVHAKIKTSVNDTVDLTIGVGGLGGGYNGKDLGDTGGATTLTKKTKNGSTVIESYISASGGFGGDNQSGGAGGSIITISENYDDITNRLDYYGGKGGDEAPGDNSTASEYNEFTSDDDDQEVTGSDDHTTFGNTVPYPEDVKEAINNFFKSNVQNSVATDYTSYGGGGGGSTGNNDDSFTNGLGATNGTGGARGISDSDAAKGPGTPGFNGGGGGAGAVGQNGGNGGKGLVIIYVDEYYV
jgi:hypothetical protein